MDDIIDMGDLWLGPITQKPEYGYFTDRVPTDHRYLNHHPHFPGIWHQYNGNTYKCHYAIRTKDGREFGGRKETGHFVECYPNGQHFYVSTFYAKAMVEQIKVKKDDVTHIRLLSMAECRDYPHAQMLCMENDSMEMIESDYGYDVPEVGIGKTGNLLYFKPYVVEEK